MGLETQDRRGATKRPVSPAERLAALHRRLQEIRAEKAAASRRAADLGRTLVQCHLPCDGDEEEIDLGRLRTQKAAAEAEATELADAERALEAEIRAQEPKCQEADAQACEDGARAMVPEVRKDCAVLRSHIEALLAMVPQLRAKRQRHKELAERRNNILRGLDKRSGSTIIRHHDLPQDAQLPHFEEALTVLVRALTAREPFDAAAELRKVFGQ
jgi:chromosome segregation ATPase